MGNVVQCCHLLSQYFKCRDTLPPPGPETSPLLSSDAETESSAPSLQDDAEGDATALCPDLAASTLQPDNFAFPDLILSSNLGVQAAGGEPMVCPLVSEAEAGCGDTGGRRVYSEVQTQTESHVKGFKHEQSLIQVEVETQTERRTDSPENKKAAETNFDILGHNLEGMKTFFEDTATGVVTETPHRDIEEDGHANLQKQHDNYSAAESTGDMSNNGFALGKGKESIYDSPHDPDGVAQIGEPRGPPEMTDCEEKCDGVDRFDEEALDKSANNIHVERSIYSLSAEETLGSQNQNEDTLSEVAESDNSIQKTDDSSLPDVKELEKALLFGENACLIDSEQMAPFLVLETPQTDSPRPQTQEESDKTDLLQETAGEPETALAVKIQAPGVDVFDIQVSGQMLVAELHQVLMDHELTCHRTCFSLALGGAVMDNLAELQSVPGLQQQQVIQVVEGSYTVRDAHLHLRHVKNLLRSLDQSDAYNGRNGCSVSCLNSITHKNQHVESGNKVLHPPECILPGCKERPLAPLLPDRSERKFGKLLEQDMAALGPGLGDFLLKTMMMKATCEPFGQWDDDFIYLCDVTGIHKEVTHFVAKAVAMVLTQPVQCLHVLTLSSWNPPPGNRKMHGDLLYLHAQTNEGKEINITASTRGFYINQSVLQPAVPKILCHSLVELLSQVSPAFKRSFTALQRERVQLHPYERIPTLFQTFTWAAPQPDHMLDGIRAEEAHGSHTGQDELMTGQSRDWNEELQGSRELPKDTLQDRILREKSIFKTNADFTAAASQGAVSVLDGNTVPLNPAEAPHQQMFIWNNMFFSLGFDVSEHYRPVGGDAAAHVAALRDLRGTQAYASLDVEGLHTLGIAVVDYRGVRVIAQTLVPGLLEKTQEQPVVYGSSDFGKTVCTHPRFMELLDKTSRPLRIQQHAVLDQNDSPVNLCSGVETKGIFGNDGRAYILDLLRTFPPDLNFQMEGTEAKPGEVIPKDCVQFGYPRPCRHRLACHRPELIEAFIQQRCKMHIKTEPKEMGEFPISVKQKTDLISHTGKKNTAARVEDDLEQGERTSQGSVTESSFDIRFNPNVCSPGVRFPPECEEETRRQRHLLWDVAAFLISHQIPVMLTNCLEQPTVVMDGATLTSALHQHGVSMRYLGTVLEQLDSMEEHERLSHVKRICVLEVIVRSAKHIFRNHLQDVDPASLSAAVSHFLNCFLGSSSSFVPESGSGEALNKRRARKRRSRVLGGVWAKLTPSDLWGRIRKDAQESYGFNIQSSSIEEVIEDHHIQRISLLREICTKTGIQVLLRDFVFESRHRSVFVEEDIMNMFPVVKHLSPSSSDACRLLQEAQRTVQKGLLAEGYKLVGQALTLFTSVCGILHTDVSSCLRLQGRLSYKQGHYTEAIGLQEKTVIISERVQGLDHPQTIQDYMCLALYCFAGGQHSTSLRLTYRARYLALLVCGEDHPQVALIDSALGLVLHGLREYDLSQKFLESALSSASKYYGATSLKYAQSLHQLATLLESKGDFRSALQHENEACAIYQSQVGRDHDKTTESKNYLKRLTQQAVSLQKVLNQIDCDSSACIPPPMLSIPDVATILHQLNLTCDIVLIPQR